MQAVRSKDTKPEIAVRKLVHRMGYRYRLHRKDLPGKPDLVFPGRRKAIFVHGCFWHGHDCPAGQNTPTSNRNYWEPKLTRNRQRDAENRTALQACGWDVLILWECEIESDTALSERLRNFVE